jgi:hypothetical protein
MRTLSGISLLVVTGALVPRAWPQAATVAMDPSKLQPKNVKADVVMFKGQKAVRIADDRTKDVPDGSRMAVVAGTDFQDGVIEVDLTGDTLPGMPEEFRGFNGIAFRVSPDGAKYEAFYLRPKNGRSEDQLQRNHSAQYESEPEYPWQRLRQETPGKYETYVDLVPGDWTKVRIEVHGGKARLFVNGSNQPVLVVNDLKHGQSSGSIALWIGPGTVAHFSNLRITRQ